MIRLRPLAVALLATGTALAAASTAHAAPPGTQSYTNTIYKVNALSSGEYGALTDTGHPSGAGLDMTIQGQGGRNLIHSYTSNTNYSLVTGRTYTITSIPNGVRQATTISGADSLAIEQDSLVTGATTADSVVSFILRVKNTGGAPVTIGARAAIDFMLAGDDGPIFTPAGGAALTSPQRYVDPAFRSFTLEDHAATLRAVWTAKRGVTDSPDLLDVDECCQSAVISLFC